MQPNGFEELARLGALREKESSLWLRVVPTELALVLSDRKWQWSARLRLGIPVPTVRDDCQGCNTVVRSKATARHAALSCMPQSGAAMTARHNLVVSIIARIFCHHILIPVRTEPGGLCHDNSKRPDIQADLPDRTLLSDVTITHPTSKSWKKLSVTKTIEAVGDRREAEKEEKYNEMARAIDMEINSIVCTHTEGCIGAH